MVLSVISVIILICKYNKALQGSHVHVFSNSLLLFSWLYGIKFNNKLNSKTTQPYPVFWLSLLFLNSKNFKRMSENTSCSLIY